MPTQVPLTVPLLILVSLNMESPMTVPLFMLSLLKVAFPEIVPEFTLLTLKVASPDILPALEPPLKVTLALASEEPSQIPEFILRVPPLIILKLQVALNIIGAAPIYDNKVVFAGVSENIPL